MTTHDLVPNNEKHEIGEGDVVRCEPFHSYVIGRNQDWRSGNLLDAADVKDQFGVDLEASLKAILTLNPNAPSPELQNVFYIFDSGDSTPKGGKRFIVMEKGTLAKDTELKDNIVGEFSPREELILGRNQGTATSLTSKSMNDSPLSKTISRNHVSIYFGDDGSVEISDLDSTNGTNAQGFVDKVRGPAQSHFEGLIRKINSGEVQNPMLGKTDEEIIGEFTSSIDLHK